MKEHHSKYHMLVTRKYRSSSLSPSSPTAAMTGAATVLCMMINLFFLSSFPFPYRDTKSCSPSSPMQLLSLVLRLRRCGTTQLARDLINVLPISQAAVQAFLVEEAVATITAGPGEIYNTSDFELVSTLDILMFTSK